jgi:hypothetical protein
MCRIVPRFVWENRPLLKEFEGTEIQSGKGSYGPNRIAHEVYGLGGESQLNFGPAAVPVAYFLFALLVSRVRRWVLTWDPLDVRLLLAPLLINICFVFLVGDSDNVFQLIFKYATVPFLILWFCSSRQRILRPGY